MTNPKVLDGYVLGDTARRHSTGLQYSRYKIVISVLQCPFYCDSAKACSHVVPLPPGCLVG